MTAEINANEYQKTKSDNSASGLIVAGLLGLGALLYFATKNQSSDPSIGGGYSEYFGGSAETGGGTGSAGMGTQTPAQNAGNANESGNLSALDTFRVYTDNSSGAEFATADKVFSLHGDVINANRATNMNPYGSVQFGYVNPETMNQGYNAKTNVTGISDTMGALLQDYSGNGWATSWGVQDNGGVSIVDKRIQQGAMNQAITTIKGSDWGIQNDPLSQVSFAADMGMFAARAGLSIDEASALYRKDPAGVQSYANQERLSFSNTTKSILSNLSSTGVAAQQNAVAAKTGSGSVSQPSTVQMSAPLGSALVGNAGAAISALANASSSKSLGSSGSSKSYETSGAPYSPTTSASGQSSYTFVSGNGSGQTYTTTRLGSSGSSSSSKSSSSSSSGSSSSSKNGMSSSQRSAASRNIGSRH